jgi:hypothetical protein
VRACESGHVDDIDWLAFVHHKTSRNCPKAMQGLYLVERGNSGALSDIVISCECGESRALAAAQKDQHSLGNCTGRRPWLGPLSREKCGRASRLLVRSASNSYFPQIYSVISIPERSSALATVLRKFEADLQIVTSVEILTMARQLNGALNASLGGRSNQEVFDALQFRLQNIALHAQGGGFGIQFNTAHDAKFPLNCGHNKAAAHDHHGDQK